MQFCWNPRELMKFGLASQPGVWAGAMPADQPLRRICLVPSVNGVGGMVSFRSKLALGLTARSIGVSYSLADTPFDAVLVIGGTRDLLGLRSVKKAGIPVIQRLDGMNWIHRKRATG